MSAAPVFDMECATRTGFKINPEWQKELFEREKEFQNEWDKKAVALNKASELLAGRKFPRKEYSVALGLCAWTPMGHPFIVTVLPYLKGATKPLDLTSFVSMTHHELLHSLVENIFNDQFVKSSKMLSKYHKEDFNVLVHLHLVALHKAVYVKLGEDELLKRTDELMKYIGGTYQRTWDIIGIEGTEPFLQELQDYNQRP